MEMRPGRLLLRTKDACDLDPERLLDVFGTQRERFVAVLGGFGPDDWAAPSRCSEWSAQDVLSHLCDCNAVAHGITAGRDDGTLDITAGFDPRTTPRGWPTVSVDESPESTLARFVSTTEELLSLTRAQLTHKFDVRLPYGPTDWTVAVLHAFWDSWLHERDVLLAQGREHPTDDDATLYAAAYGLFIAAAVASIFGSQVQEKLKLGGGGGGIYELHTCGDAVTLTVDRLTTAGPSAADVTDALAGRSSVATALGDLSSNSRAALSHLADFFNTPVE
jgi:uncharacterized protein (TIGR03083 family)